MKKSTKLQDIYQLKIVLDGTSPKVWRRIQVPKKFTFAELRDAIQVAMEWACSPDYWFLFSDFKTKTHVRIQEDSIDGEDFINAKTTQISKYLKKPGDVIAYEHLIGDSWYHIVALEKILQASVNCWFPKCTGGRRSCPPWDVGGVGGFAQLVEAISDPNHPEYSSFKDWLKLMGLKKFNPDGFNYRKVKYFERRWVIGPAE